MRSWLIYPTSTGKTRTKMKFSHKVQAAEGSEVVWRVKFWINVSTLNPYNDIKLTENSPLGLLQNPVISHD